MDWPIKAAAPYDGRMGTANDTGDQDGGNIVARARKLLHGIAAFSGYVLRRFDEDHCTRVAASLSFTTLLALVPLMAIGFALISAFPVFDSVQDRIQDFLFRNFVPEFGGIIREQFLTFVANTGKLTAFGIVIIAVTALFLFLTVEDSFNVIWRASDNRPFPIRLLIFWAILTLGPLLMGASVAISSYIFTITVVRDLDALVGIEGNFVRSLPYLLEVLALTLVYKLLPNKPVRWPHAIVGSLVASLLLELLKKGFALYVTSFPAQQTIYGAVSTLPLLLVWMYVAWAAVLIGAEIVASLPEYRIDRAEKWTLGTRLRRRFSVSLAILGELADAIRKGEGGRNMNALRAEIPVDETYLEQIVHQLRDIQYIAETVDDEWVLARDLQSTTIYDLYRDLGLKVAFEGRDRADGAPWHQKVAGIVDRSDKAQAEIMDRTLGEIFEIQREDRKKSAA